MFGIFRISLLQSTPFPLLCSMPMEKLSPELFPNLLFMPTGGVELDRGNIEGWFKAGVCAVGMGSKLVSKDVMENKKYSELQASTKEALEIINSLRK